ncbi:ABC transporter ATP-binding protein [Pseudobacteriovorax antillogorgiicola]|uniref:Iron complex transport system ATP-binding protein n=1 Tax=Pseudobacteriovorax antillogorgiicola TaxID=1513793 RepID=A0A1Y6BEB1_9BACT|nr:ABC transporter ATP-binding protein [Pseudobacteriovorax antillogorgiicola]TCS56467.1 iron complex transport system ATP-binding protein [Pseudobacteriovorax antillogorgiicola]SMF05124.1 iron complex transport system ATP-binding protein [Pseudobacteriovorax antillogorgiicola]
MGFSFEISGLSFEASSRRILTLTELSLPSAGLVTILGPNGAGKTTMLRILAGLEREYNGKIRLWGKDLKDHSSQERSRNVAWVPSELDLSFDISLVEMVGLGRYPWNQGYPTRDDRLAVEKVLERLELLGLRDRMLSTLSSGERQKAQVARALASEARCLILDEPCSHLDIKARYELMEILQMVGQSALVLMTSHDHYIIPRYTDWSLALKTGEMFSYQSGALSDQEVSLLFDLKGLKFGESQSD